MTTEALIEALHQSITTDDLTLWSRRLHHREEPS